MEEQKLIIFMKNPILGEVKSRLAADIGEQSALQVYTVLLDKCREECQKVDSERHLYYHQQIVENDAWQEELFQKKLQVEGELGEKMSSAFFELQGEEEEMPTLIIGTDCYDLDHKLISLAFQALKMTDVVIGPANDGGYYLLGSRKYYPQLFEGIDWSTNKVMSQTLAKVNQMNLNYFLLQELIDLDTFDDLKKSGYPDLKV